jgi:hypothetical protein
LPQHASVHLMADGKSTLCPMDTLTGLTLSLVHRAAPITSSSSFRWRSTATPTAWPRAFGADTSTPATSLGGSGSELARDPRGLSEAGEHAPLPPGGPSQARAAVLVGGPSPVMIRPPEDCIDTSRLFRRQWQAIPLAAPSYTPGHHRGKQYGKAAR